MFITKAHNSTGNTEVWHRLDLTLLLTGLAKNDAKRTPICCNRQPSICKCRNPERCENKKYVYLKFRVRVKAKPVMLRIEYFYYSTERRLTDGVSCNMFKTRANLQRIATLTLSGRQPMENLFQNKLVKHIYYNLKWILFLPHCMLKIMMTFYQHFQLDHLLRKMFRDFCFGFIFLRLSDFKALSNCIF